MRRDREKPVKYESRAWFDVIRERRIEYPDEWFEENPNIISKYTGYFGINISIKSKEDVRRVEAINEFVHGFPAVEHFHIAQRYSFDSFGIAGRDMDEFIAQFVVSSEMSLSLLIALALENNWIKGVEDVKWQREQWNTDPFNFSSYRTDRDYINRFK